MLRQLLVPCLVALAMGYEVDEGVIIGTSDNFDTIIAENQHVLVEFYAPWCGHCKTLAPEYAAAAQELANQESATKLMKVDATVEEALGSKFDVSGFPTLKFFNNGKATEYTGGRTKDEILAYLKKKTGPPAEPLTTFEAAETAKKDNEVAVFGFFESEDTQEAMAFLAAAADVELMFFIITDKGVTEKFEGVTAPAIHVYTDFETEAAVYDGDFGSADDISKFCLGSSLPLVMEFNDKNSQKIFGGSVKSHLLLFASKKSDAFEGLLEEMKGAAKEHKGEILFIYIDTDVPDNKRISEFFGIGDHESPCVRLINTDGDMAKFKPESTEITTAVLDKFANDYKEGKLQQNLKSADTPADWDAKPVKVLTGQNFADVALDATKDVLVEFYAPWCGHCKQLVPIYDQLAEAYEGEPSVVIAKMDSTENEVADVAIQSFPTIKLFPKGADAAVIDFEGDRTFDDMSAFLAEHTGKTAADVDADGTGGGDGEKHEEL